MRALGRFAVTHRWWVVGAWVVAILAIQVLASAAGGANYKNDFKLPHTEAQTVSDLLTKAKLDQANSATGTVVLHAKTGTLTGDPAGFTAAVSKLCQDPAARVSAVAGPWGSVTCVSGVVRSAANDPGLLDSAKTVAIVQVTFNEDIVSLAPPAAVYKDLQTLRSDRLQVEFTGDIFDGVDAKSGGVSPQLLGFIAAFVILILVFRTLGATALPLLSAAAALGTGIGALALLTHVMSVADFASQLLDLMVIGVGIDYALFIVTRHRRNLLRGMGVNESIENALNTSGRAVLLAASTVCVAILGMCALGVSFLYGVAVGVSLGVLLTMIASLTLLPALLSFLGLKVLPRSQRKAVRAGQFEDAHTKTGFWGAWSRLVGKRPLFVALGAGALLILLAIPFFSIRLGHADQSNNPAGSTTRRGYDLIQTGFGKGYNSTLELVVSGPGASDRAYLAKVATAIRATADVNKPSVQAIPIAKSIAFVGFKSISGPQDQTTTDLVGVLRKTTLPPLYQGTSNHIYVYGETAINVDFAKVLSAKMVLFILAVVGLSFLLLVIAFRSIVVPLTAAAMNLLAAGASFGIVVAIFQWGWLGDTIGVGKGGPVEAFVPVIFFSVLFGLSMDYQVFLVSRMHEEWVHTHDNRRAITVGQAETGGIITAAGLIMIAVFSSFILGDARVIKLFGIGLGSAIFVDAFIVRTMLVPSLMHLLGPANWWFPKWLERFTPRISLEAPEPAPGSAVDPEPEDRELVRV
jgi:putative drug exporter of the RND superfamily